MHRSMKHLQKYNFYILPQRFEFTLGWLRRSYVQWMFESNLGNLSQLWATLFYHQMSELLVINKQSKLALPRVTVT